VTGRIALLTFHRCVDYGSHWQARCLLAGLARRGHEVILADHACDRVRRAALACALAPLGGGADERADVPQQVAKIRAFRRAVADLPLGRRFDLARPDTMEPADIALFGSDEIWNLDHPCYGGTPLFFGEGVPAARYATYAASAGSYDAARGLDSARAGRLAAFADVSVRDDNTRRLYRDATGREPAIVLDPCLQFPPPADGGAEGGPGRLVVYGHGFPSWFAAAVVAVARRRGLSIVSVGYRNAFADEQRIAAGPEEFRTLIASAAAVATSVFHGCVFALAFGRPFVAVATPYRRDKLRDLVALVGAEGHLADERRPEALDTILSAPADAVVERRIEALRARSDTFLDRVLG